MHKGNNFQLYTPQPKNDVESNGKGFLWPFGLFLYDHCALQCLVTRHCLFDWLFLCLSFTSPTNSSLMFDIKCLKKLTDLFYYTSIFSRHRWVMCHRTVLGTSFRCRDHWILNHCLVLLLIISFTCGFVLLFDVFQTYMFIQSTVI